MKKLLIVFIMLLPWCCVNGYWGNTHGRITIKTTYLLNNANYSGYAKYVHYNIFNERVNFPYSTTFQYPDSAPSNMCLWGTEVHPTMKVQQTTVGYLIDRLPGSFVLGDTIRCWANENGLKDITGGVVGGVFLLAALIWVWGPGLTAGELLTSGLWGLIGSSVFTVTDKANYPDYTYAQNLAVSAMWPDNFATFGNKNTIYLGFCPLAHGRSTSPQTFWTIGHAHNICEEYYNWAKQEWNSGNRTQALRWLGRACHFIQDGVQPNHRAPAGLYGLMAQIGHGWYEDTCDVVALSETQFYPNSAALNPNFDVSDKVVDLGNTARGYLYFCDGLPTWASWMWGGHNDQKTMVAKAMMPLACKSTAELIAKFFNEVGYTPDPVTNLRCDYAKEDEVKIRWDYSVPKVIDCYVIRRRIAGGSWSQIGTSSPEQTYWVDNTVNRGTIYEYEVCAKQGNLLSPSATISVSVPWLNEPSLLSVADRFETPHRMVIKWQDKSAHSNQFRIDRKVNNGGWQEGYGWVNAPTDTFSDNTVTLYTLYTYRVVAVDDQNHISSFSNEKGKVAGALATDDSLMTAYNTGNKIAVDPQNPQNIYVVYYDNYQHDVKDALSTDEGNTFSVIQSVAGCDKNYPAIAVDQQGKSHIVWGKWYNTWYYGMPKPWYWVLEFYHSYYTTSWQHKKIFLVEYGPYPKDEGPDQHPQPAPTRPILFIIAQDSGFVAIEEGPNHNIWVSSFSLQTSAYSQRPIANWRYNPCVAYDLSGRLALVYSTYEDYADIYFRYRNFSGGSWSDEQWLAYGLHPYLSGSTDTLSLVLTNSSGGYKIDYHNLVWDGANYILSAPVIIDNGDWGIVANNNYVVWEKNKNIYYAEVYDGQASPPVNLSQTAGRWSIYPHADISPQKDALYVIWTEGNSTNTQFYLTFRKVEILPKTTMVFPNGGESFYAGEVHTITWTAEDNVVIAKIDSILLTTDGGNTWEPIVVNLSGDTRSYDWLVPYVNSSDCKILVVVSDYAGNKTRDESDFTFSITTFNYCGFEDGDAPCLENTLIGVDGVNNYGALRSGPEGGVNPHSGDKMYKIYGNDYGTSGNNYVIFKILDYDFPITSNNYLSFWIYVKEAPTDSGHICVDCHTKSGKILRAWTKYNRIIDQTSQIIHPAWHSAPKGQWVQYIFTLNPAAGETIDYLELIYDDRDPQETGNFVAYIDDIQIFSQFPLENTWYFEVAPNDTNASVRFEPQSDDGVRLMLDNQGAYPDTFWSSVPWLRKDIPDITVGEKLLIYWQQYDLATASLYSLLIQDEQGDDRWLTYAPNAPNHWSEIGVVDMGDPTQRYNYNKWEGFSRNVYNDFYNEYGTSPKILKAVRLGHYSRKDWSGDHGCSIKDLRFTEDRSAFSYSGFEPTHTQPLENCILEKNKQCITSDSAGLYKLPVPPNGSEWAYLIKGEDISTDANSYAIFKVFDENLLITDDPTFISFKINVAKSPGNYGHISLDGITWGGLNLKNFWHNQYGWIIDQNGTWIHPAVHTVSDQDQWVEYIFNLTPAAGEILDNILVVYDDGQNAETGEFRAYIDDIKVWRKFPYNNHWYAEILGNDPNAILKCIADGDSVRLYIDNNGNQGEGAFWTDYHPTLRNDITDLPVEEHTIVYWEQYDRDHSLILGLLIHDNQGQDRWLYYAKNASNWWQNTGWVDMGDPTPHYNTWEWFYRNIRSDYIAEYNAIPEVIKELRLEHFAYSSWTGDHGGTIKRLFIGEDTEPPLVQVIQPNGGEKLEIGSVYPIIWNVTDTTRIGLQTIYYSTNSGADWHNVTGIDTIFEPIASYQYNWTVPEHPSDNCLIKVVSKDIANNTGTDMSNNPFSICYFTSSDSTATAGNGEKLVYDNGVLHFVFTSEDSIFYSYSVDQGNTWHKKQLIDFGEYPAIGVDELHRVHLVYKKGDGYWYKE
ncbi:MAG: hypothetical protein ABIL18_03825 [candidate division WOR-3 bacterium]